MITLGQLLDLYDCSCNTLVVNDNELKCVYKGSLSDYFNDNDDNWEGLNGYNVMAFGFYDGEFCVRIDMWGELK